jgi:quinol monooxygenase YgiN
MNLATYYEEKQVQQTSCSIVELRQYTLHPGKRDVLIDLFDREFVETQEKVGIKVLGQFRDLDNPDRFVWLRGFDDMPSRAQALSRFYGGPVWKAYREAANATMIDSDNVLLLHPAHLGSGFPLENSRRLSLNDGGIPRGLFVANIYYLDSPADDVFVDFFDLIVKPILMKAGADILVHFVTEDSRNTFPALPVREGEQVFVWFAQFKDQAAYELYRATLSRSRRLRDEVLNALVHPLKRAPEVLRLIPTRRSLLHG